GSLHRCSLRVSGETSGTLISPVQVAGAYGTTRTRQGDGRAPSLPSGDAVARNGSQADARTRSELGPLHLGKPTSVNRNAMSATGHVWTAPWQELSDGLQHWSGAVTCPACWCGRYGRWP